MGGEIPARMSIHWFLNGKEAGTGKTFTVEDPTEDYVIEAKLMDENGNVVSQSGEKTVKVKNGVFDKIKWFLGELLDKILGFFKIVC